MGEANRKKARLLDGDPLCYCCATEPATTVDHFPPRICFPSGMHPVGFEFPACERCNRSTSGLEQVVALYLIAFNQDDAARHPEHMRKVIRGVMNNHPELLPILDVTAREKRRYLAEAGFPKPDGVAIADLPIAVLPEGNRNAFRKFAGKLACAHYYRRYQKPLPLDFHVWADWLPFYEPFSDEFVAGLLPALRYAEKGERPNIDIGTRMVWRWVEDDAGLFGILTQFSQSFYFVSVMTPPITGPMQEAWRPHAEFVDSL